MATENVELVRRCYELWHSRDWAALPEVCDPEVEVDLSRNVFNPGVYRGYAGMERWVAAVDEIWSEFRVVPTDFVHTADKVMTEVMVHGKGKGSGVDVEMRLFNVWTFRDGRVLKVFGGYRDRDEALAAAGLTESGDETIAK